MWSAANEQVDSQCRLVRLQSEGEALSYGTVLELLWGDEAFRNFFLGCLKTSPFVAFRWETPPLTRGLLGRPFEYALIDCPELQRSADRRQFDEHFRGGMTVTFQNQGGDATLVAPAPLAAESCYPHLGVFVREGPEVQAHALLQATAEAMQSRLRDQPVWLSTAGMGVAWLHLRLDSVPKYYGYSPYREFEERLAT